MRWPVVVVLFALALPACQVEVVPGRDVGTPVTAARTTPGGPAAPDTGADATPAGAETRTGDERTAVQISDAFWRTWFAGQGRRYRAPEVAGGYTGRGGPSCGGEPSVPGNASYCPPGNFIAWDEDLMRAGYTRIGDAWVYLVITHEWGHAVQAQVPRRQVDQAVELQADCLSGAALQGAADQGLVRIEQGDDEEITRALEAVADDYAWTDRSSHGNAQQRSTAFRTGVTGGVGGCLRG